MALWIRNEKVNALATHLAGILGVTKTEAVRRALNEALERDRINAERMAQSKSRRDTSVKI